MKKLLKHLDSAEYSLRILSENVGKLEDESFSPEYDYIYLYSLLANDDSDDDRKSVYRRACCLLIRMSTMQIESMCDGIEELYGL